MSNQSSLRAGFVEFADPTFLVLGESSAFDWLAEQIERRQEVALGRGSDKDSDRLLIRPSDCEGRLTRVGQALEWQISAKEAALVSQQLRQLAANSSPAHVYLDPSINLTGVQIMASKGEYDPATVLCV